MSAYLVVQINTETRSIFYARTYSDRDPTFIGKKDTCQACILSASGSDYEDSVRRLIQDAAFRFPWLIAVMPQDLADEMRQEVREIVGRGFKEWEKWL